MISFVNDPDELKGRRALVTGGSRGIGGAIVRRLLSAGAQVVAVARNPVEDFPADAALIQGDVSSLEGVQAIVEQTSAIFGGVDILVNNAASGRIYPGGSLTIPDSGWQDDFNTNFFSAVRLTAALLPGMLERKSGAIVNISSLAALTPPSGAMIHYSSAKAAMNAWSKTLATAPDGHSAGYCRDRRVPHFGSRRLDHRQQLHRGRRTESFRMSSHRGQTSPPQKARLFSLVHPLPIPCWS